MTINAPPRPIAHPDRHLDAQEAIEPSVLEIVDRTVAAGWTEVEMFAAIIAVAENRMLAIEANGDLDKVLTRFRGQA